MHSARAADRWGGGSPSHVTHDRSGKESIGSMSHTFHRHSTLWLRISIAASGGLSFRLPSNLDLRRLNDDAGCGSGQRVW